MTEQLDEVLLLGVCGYMKVSREDIISDINEFDARELSRVHDWRNYVPDAFCDQWDSLSFQTKLALYAVAKPMSDREEWD